MAAALTLWLFFSVLMGASPVLLNGLRARINGELNWLIVVIGRGELLIVAAGLCGTGTGLLVASPAEPTAWKISLAGVTTLILFFSASLHADISAAYRRPRLIETPAVCQISLILYAMALLASTSCVIHIEVWK